MINRLTYTVIDCYWGPKESITITSNNKSFQLLIDNFRQIPDILTSYTHVKLYDGDNLIEEFTSQYIPNKEEIKEELLLNILTATVCQLRSKKEYDIIESLYNNLLKCDLIHSIEDFKAGKVIKGSIEEALIYWIWRALVQAKATNNDSTMSENEIRALFEAGNENMPF
jgi:hypothetical protein